MNYQDQESAAYAEAVATASARLAKLGEHFAQLDRLTFQNDNMSHIALCQAAAKVRADADNIVNYLIKWSDSFSGVDGQRARSAVGWDRFTQAHPDV